jgi:phosphatidate cytidylyltransferase
VSATPEPRSKLWFINPRAWPDLAPRLGSAAVLIAMTVVSLYLGGYIFAAVVGAVFAGAYREWETMVTLRPLTPFGMVLIGLVALSGLIFPLFGPLGTLALVAIGAVAAIVRGGEGSLWRAGGLIYFGLVVMATLALRGNAPIGILAGVFLGTVVWLTDTGAFFTGRQVGGEKLAPEISPSKTWSGAIGGLALGTVCGFLLWILFTTSPWWIGLGFAALMSVLGQLGDLSESALKRRFRIKDSGDIIPGHGGLMDRLDSLTFPVLFMFAVGVLHMGIASVASGFLSW